MHGSADGLVRHRLACVCTALGSEGAPLPGGAGGSLGRVRSVAHPALCPRPDELQRGTLCTRASSSNVRRSKRASTR